MLVVKMIVVVEVSAVDNPEQSVSWLRNTVLTKVLLLPLVLTLLLEAH